MSKDRSDRKQIPLTRAALAEWNETPSPGHQFSEYIEIGRMCKKAGLTLESVQEAFDQQLLTVLTIALNTQKLGTETSSVLQAMLGHLEGIQPAKQTVQSVDKIKPSEQTEPDKPKDIVKEAPLLKSAGKPAWMVS